jgi:hypothetical protein
LTSRITPLLLAAALSAMACATRPAAPEFIVTTEPLNVGVVSAKLCIALDVDTKDGVWWWQPGASGCDSRSTGPTVFRGESATINTWHMNRGHSAEFQLQRIMPPGSTESPVAVVRLVSREGTMTAVATTATVPTSVRRDLDIPERAPRVTRR